MYIFSSFAIGGFVLLQL